MSGVPFQFQPIQVNFDSINQKDDGEIAPTVSWPIDSSRESVAKTLEDSRKMILSQCVEKNKNSE